MITLRADGESIAGIVRTLNGEGIDTPAAYHRRTGTYANMYTKGNSPLWTDYKVNSILNNEMYIGTFVYGKSRVKEVGSRRKKMLPSGEWKRIPKFDYPKRVSADSAESRVLFKRNRRKV